MLIGGIQKTTLLDYPWKVATLLFTVGCNLRCQFCYNPQFVLPEKIKKLWWDLLDNDAVFSFLKERKDFIEWVVICGWEPTLQSDLYEFIEKIKDMWLLVKLDTNGSNPALLGKLLQDKLIDYVAMDIKDDWDNRPTLTWWINEDIKKYKESISLLQSSNVEYEFRTTVIKNYHTEQRILAIAQSIEWAPLYAIQNFTYNTELLNPYFKGRSFLQEELNHLKKVVSPLVKKCVIRA